MKIVLSKPMSVAKVSILVGGPDWPTSVMCGILHLDPVGVLLGTTPVALLILPTILAAPGKSEQRFFFKKGPVSFYH